MRLNLDLLYKSKSPKYLAWGIGERLSVFEKITFS
jgi:hypothetical protein